MRLESSALALFSSARRLALSPRPARFMKYVSIRMPEAGLFGETLLDASVRAIVCAFVNSPTGGCVDSVLTLETHRDLFLLGIRLFLHKGLEPRYRSRLLIICLTAQQYAPATRFQRHSSKRQEERLNAAREECLLPCRALRMHRDPCRCPMGGRRVHR